MCVTSMNGKHAIMNYCSSRDIDFNKAVTELIQIPGEKFTDNFDSHLEWINKYAGHLNFLPTYEVPNTDNDLHSLGTALSIATDPSDEEVIRQELERTNIKYIDSSFSLNQAPPLIVNLIEYSIIWNQLKTIAKCYLFIHGGIMDVKPVHLGSCGIVMPPQVHSLCLLNFLDLNKYNDFHQLGPTQTELLNDFMAYRKLDLSSMQMNYECSYYDSYASYKDSSDFQRAETVEITKYDMYLGQECYNLLVKVLCAFIDKCLSYSSFISIENPKKVIYDQNCGGFHTFRKTKPEDFQQTNKYRTVGVYKMYKTISDAIMSKHLFACEHCGRPFITKRNDAKTCSDNCRIQMSKDRKKLKEALAE